MPTLKAVFITSNKMIIHSLKEDARRTVSGVAGRILITGANGQLGMELREVSTTNPQYEFIFFSRYQLAIENTEAVKAVFKKYAPLFCINCAAYTAVDKAESEKTQAFRINAEAVGILAAACKEYNCRFIHISSDYVFDGNASIPYKEDSPTNPLSVYGSSKLEGEIQALYFNPSSIIIRTSWVYSEYGKNFVKTMSHLMNEKDEINVVDDQYGSPTYAGDLAEAIFKIIATVPTPQLPLTFYGIYHFSNEGVITWYDLAIAIKELLVSRCKINPIASSQYLTLAKRPAYSVLDKTKIQRDFGIELRYWKKSLETCLQKMKKFPK